MTEREQFEAHIKNSAWYRVLSEAAKDDDEGASVFRMARMAASEAWQASRRAALDEAAKVCDELADGWNQIAQGATDGRYDFMAEAGDRCADEIRTLSGPKET